MKRFLRGLFRAATDGHHANLPKIRIGVCAMDKKARSKPMKEILQRLTAWGEFEVIIFGDEVILEKPTDEWPHVECLLCWHSDGFPLKKAQEYILNRRPFLVNDVFLQDELLDRRKVYKLLVEKNIPVPTHIIVERDNLQEDPPGFVEDEDYVELNGQRIYKPFVEKPVSGEDHNIWVYYPHSMGGGVKYLFRKVDDKASKYDSSHDGRVRRDGSYIYEEFLPTGGTDVKVYTVGPRYAHAEARKSPVVDGRVLRNADGKEMRFPVLLSPQEKEIARMVCLAFGQKVCGFDLLRSEKGRSYVCDVNGWSFVKNSKKYYDDAADIMRSIILSALAPHRLNIQPNLPTYTGGLTNPDTGSNVVSDDDDEEALVPGMDVSEVRHTAKRMQKEELRCVLAVIRHGDRTPKQKLKVVVTQEPLLTLFHKYKDAKGKQAKLKSPMQLQELLDITRQLVKDFERRDDEKEGGGGPGPQTDEDREAAQEVRGKLRIMQTVLESGGQFSGINRKVQIKPLKWGIASEGPAAAAAAAGAAAAAAVAAQAGSHLDGVGGSVDLLAPLASSDVHGSGTVAGSQTSPTTGSSTHLAGAGAPVLEEALLILKWGGVLTHAGRQQAEDLGKIYRMVMYPSGGNGLLRLHSTYRHDLKIYSSDEGRVQTSAAAFTKAMLDLEGNSLTPILVSLVNKDASMLEAFGKGASDDIADAKEALYQAMTWDPEKPSLAPLAVSKRSHTPMISPPMSPKVSRTSSFATAKGGPGMVAAAAAAAAAVAAVGAQQQQQQQQQQGDSGSTGGGAAVPPTYVLPVLQRMVDRLQALKAAARQREEEIAREAEREAAAAAAAEAVAAVEAAAEEAAAALAAEEAAATAVTEEAQPQQAESGEQGQEKEAEQKPEAKREEAQPGEEVVVAEAAPPQVASDAPAVAAEEATEAPKADEPTDASGDVAVPSGASVETAAEAAQAGEGAGTTAEAATTPVEATTDAATAVATAAADDDSAPGPPPLSPRRHSAFEPMASIPLPGDSAPAAIATAVGAAVEAAAQGAVPAPQPRVPHPSPAAFGSVTHIQPLRPSPLSKRAQEPAAAAQALFSDTLLRANSAPSIIARLPDTPLGLLRRLVDLLRLLEDRLRQLVREEGAAARGSGPPKYSSLSMDPKERVHDDSQPCGGEKMLLMFDRWHKLLKSFYNEKKDRFDISKVPDIYDSAKYDAIHNAHLGLEALEELYIVAKLLADVVIPCEYGLDPGGKLRIGSKIANELLGKLLVDLASMREESIATACMEPHGARGGSGTPNYDQLEGELGRISLQDEAMAKAGLHGGPASVVSSSRGGPMGREGDLEGGAGGEMEPAETETIHRLCPTYASDINSPLRHVRTRIYFTSESHMHSLVNVLRWCHLGSDAGELCAMPPITPPSGTGGTSSPDLRASAGGAPAAAAAAATVAAASAFVRGGGGGGGGGSGSVGPDSASSPMMTAAAVAAAAAASGTAGPYARQYDNSPLLSEGACAQLDSTSELDYMTQVVFRMYENKTVPVESPERFRVEVLFSPGANYNPFDFNTSLHNNHVLPIVPRTALHKNDGITLAEMEEKLMPFSSTRKFNKCSYALQYSLRAPQLHIGSRYGSGGNLGHNAGARSTASMAGNDSQNDMAKAVSASQPAAGGAQGGATSADA